MNQTLAIKKPARSVMSVHTSLETKKRLEKLAVVTRRSKSFLINEALHNYLKEEEAFVKSVKQGIADADAGRVYSTKEARAILTKMIKSA